MVCTGFPAGHKRQLNYERSYDRSTLPGLKQSNNMLKPINQLKRPLLFFVMSMVMCWAEIGHTFEARNGIMTAKVNLRKSPGLDGEIMTLLAEGEKVIIKDKHDEWYMVVVENEGYGYKGWIYGTYLKEILKKEVSPSENIPEKEIVDTQAPLKGDKEAEPEVSPASQTDVPPLGNPPDVEEKIEITPSADVMMDTPVEAVLTQDYSTDIEKIFPKVTPEKTPPIIFNTQKDQLYQDVIGWIRLLTRILPVIFACLALLFSYKAFQLSKACRDMIIQLQQKELSPRRHNDRWTA